MNKENIVIIGSSVAALSAIEAIREKNETLPITVITKEKEIGYSRPLISHPDISEKQLNYCDKNFYKKNSIEVIVDEVTSIEINSVVLKTGKKIHFTKLLLAVGGKPIITEIKGIHNENVFTLTTLEDAKKIKAKIKQLPSVSAVIIGCGMIGIKAAGFLKHLGVKVTIVELMDKPFASVLDTQSGKIVAEKIRGNVGLVLNNSIVEIKEKECILKTGEKLKSDIVVCAIGVVPNTDLAKKLGIKTNRGIIVDSKMATSQKNVYAVGDCVEALDILKNENRPLPIWPIAYQQGKVAGYNISGFTTDYAGSFVMNSVDVFGLPIITLGLSTEKDCEEIISFDEQSKIYKKLLVKDGKIIGAIFVGDIARAGIITGFIKDKMDVSNFKCDLLKDTFGYIYVPKEFRSKEIVATEI